MEGVEGARCGNGALPRRCRCSAAFASPSVSCVAVEAATSSPCGQREVGRRRRHRHERAPRAAANLIVNRDHRAGIRVRRRRAVEQHRRAAGEEAGARRGSPPSSGRAAARRAPPTSGTAGTSRRRHVVAVGGGVVVVVVAAVAAVVVVTFVAAVQPGNSPSSSSPSSSSPKTISISFSSSSIGASSRGGQTPCLRSLRWEGRRRGAAMVPRRCVWESGAVERGARSVVGLGGGGGRGVCA